jgi:geranylgeranyl pyrophosphate synthase
MRCARVLDIPLEPVMPLAVSVELLHCASLIVDDLPCMDDSPFRREQPSVHVRFDEASSLLAAFALVALAARLALESDSPPKYRSRLHEFQIQLLRTLDCSGLIGGQALDLHLPGHASLPAGPDISELKTVPLFRLAVSAGSLFADLHSNEQALLNCFAQEFGLAFQLTDDLLDGHATDHKLLDEKLTTLRAAIAPFGKASSHLAELVDYLDARVSERAA